MREKLPCQKIYNILTSLWGLNWKKSLAWKWLSWENSSLRKKEKGMVRKIWLKSLLKLFLSTHLHAFLMFWKVNRKAIICLIKPFWVIEKKEDLGFRWGSGAAIERMSLGNKVRRQCLPRRRELPWVKSVYCRRGIEKLPGKLIYSNTHLYQVDSILVQPCFCPNRGPQPF